MTNGGYKFDRELFDILISQFKSEFRISSNFGDYEKVREIINDETLVEQDERVGGKLKKYKDIGKLSEDTIKRIFGFITYEGKHDLSTCHIIARKLKYRGWDDFCQKTIQQYDSRKGFKSLDMYEFGSLIENRSICIGWYPEKYCILNYLGDYKFKVIESYGMKSEINRVFETIGFELAESVSKYAYPDVIIRPFLDDDPDVKNIEIGIIPLEYLL